MYKSRQCTYSHANQVWGNGQWFRRANDDTTGTNFPTKDFVYEYQFFQWQTAMIKRTCLSIDEDDTDTDFSRSKQQWRNPLVDLLMVTKMRTSSTVNTRTTYQWKQVDSGCVYAHAKQGLRKRTIPTSKWRYRYQILPTSKQQWKEPLAFALLLDGIKDADKFNS